MKRYYFPDDKESKASVSGSEEDPPNNVVKQNDAGNQEGNKEDIKVPDKALEHYKESAADTEE